MICFNCDSDKEAAFFQEEFPCCSCGDENVVEYNACPDCGCLWRSINGVPQEESKMHIDDFAGFGGEVFVADQTGPINHEELSEEEQRIMENVAEHLTKIGKMSAGEVSMSDHVHRCLQCGSTGVDVNDGIYKCTEDGCGFEWEVVKFD